MKTKMFKAIFYEFRGTGKKNCPILRSPHPLNQVFLRKRDQCQLGWPGKKAKTG